MSDRRYGSSGKKGSKKSYYVSSSGQGGSSGQVDSGQQYYGSSSGQTAPDDRHVAEYYTQVGSVNQSRASSQFPLSPQNVDHAPHSQDASIGTPQNTQYLTQSSGYNQLSADYVPEPPFSPAGSTIAERNWFNAKSPSPAGQQGRESRQATQSPFAGSSSRSELPDHRYMPPFSPAGSTTAERNWYNASPSPADQQGRESRQASQSPFVGSSSRGKRPDPRVHSSRSAGETSSGQESAQQSSSAQPDQMQRKGHEKWKEYADRLVKEGLDPPYQQSSGDQGSRQQSSSERKIYETIKEYHDRLFREGKRTSGYQTRAATRQSSSGSGPSQQSSSAQADQNERGKYETKRDYDRRRREQAQASAVDDARRQRATNHSGDIEDVGEKVTKDCEAAERKWKSVQKNRSKNDPEYRKAKSAYENKKRLKDAWEEQKSWADQDFERYSKEF